MKDYVLQIENAAGEVFRKYELDGENVIGAFPDESFAVRFRNSTPSGVEVKLSIDGTDVANGGLADFSITGKRWFVRPYDSLLLRAWPETTAGGAGFVFTEPSDSVALHTHGNAGHLGVIAAAVFQEDKAVRFEEGEQKTFGTTRFDWDTSRFTYCCDLNSVSAVGAGAYMEQAIRNVAGLRSPRFSRALRVRHLWWHDLLERLRKQPVIPGFPGEQGIHLGSVPRKESNARFVQGAK